MDIYTPKWTFTPPKSEKHGKLKKSGGICLVKFHRDLTRPKNPPNGGDCKGTSLISGKSRLVKYYNLARHDDWSKFGIWLFLEGLIFRWSMLNFQESVSLTCRPDDPSWGPSRSKIAPLDHRSSLKHWRTWNEQWKKPWLVVLYRGLYYPDYNKPL